MNDEDASELVAYDNDAPGVEVGVPYDFADYGDKYLSLDTGDATLWRANTVEGNVYFDMAMQFNPSAEAPEVAADTKIAVYQNSSSNVVILAGDGAGGVSTNVTTTQVAPGTWARLTISAVNGNDGFNFTVRLNGNVLTDGTNDSFPSMTDDGTISYVGFSGTGKLDDFVARTTDPFLQNPVATIGGEGYASLDDALSEADANTVVTLQTDATSALSLAAGDSYKIALNGHNFGGFTANGDTALSSSTDANGVTTYSGTAGVAAVALWNNGLQPYTWFASFDEAYAYAHTQFFASKWSDMKVKVGADFTPANITGNRIKIWNLVFEATTEDPISISLVKDTTSFFYAVNSYTYPANATLTLPVSQTFAASGNGNSEIAAISGGTLVIPAGITATANGYAAFDSVSAISGAGTIVAPPDPTSFLYSSALASNSKLAQSGWQGTLSVSNVYAGALDLAKFGNANSKIRFNGFTVSTFGANNSSSYGMAIELVGDGLTLNGDYTRALTFTGTLSGDGALNVTQMGTGNSYLTFSGDISGFNGDVTLSSTTARIGFGAQNTGSGGSIAVANGVTMAIPATATWTAANLIVNGNLTANGAVALTGSLWGDKGTGVYRANNADAAVSVATSWNGTYIVGWSPSAGTEPFYINNYGKNANATIQIEGVNGEFVGYPRDGSTAPTVNAKVVLNADWTVGDGYSTADTTFASLSGPGNLTVNDKNSYSYKLVYNITKLDGYTGTLGGRNGKFVIGTVNLDEAPEANEVVVKTEKGAYGEFPGTPAVTVDGGATNYKLVYATVNSTEGLYLAVAQVGDDCYATYDAAFAAAATAEAEEVVALVDTSYPAPEGWKIDSETGNYVKKVYVAQIGDTKYETLKDAVDGAKDGNVITLLGDLPLDTRVEPNVGAGTSLAINLGGHTLTRTGTSGNGSVIDVKSGNVIVTNGVIYCTQDDTDIVADGVYAITVRSGAALTLDDLAVTVNSQAGACVYPFDGATVTILGGTYGNETAVAYQYKANWTGMAVNQANVATQLITIYGGSFYKVDPSLGDDSWAEGAGTFLAPGKATTLEGNYWVVDTATYTVRFFNDVEGVGSEIGTSQTISYGETAQAPATNPTKSGYTFTGWSSDATAAITADTDFYPVWTGKEFTIATYTNGVANTSKTFTYAGESVDPADPVYDTTAETWDGKWYATDGDSTEFAFDPDGDATQIAYATIGSAGSTPITPGSDDGGVYDTAAEAEAAAEKVTPAATEAVANALGEEATATYLEKFEAKAVDNGDGTYSVKVELTAAAETALEAEATTNVAVAVAAQLSEIAADAVNEQTEVSVTGATPGFYYSISYGTSVGAINTEGDRVMAGPSGSVTLQTPAKAENATSGFYKVNINVAPKPVTP